MDNTMPVESASPIVQDSNKPPEKIKRPVGRPRKDGLPAGSRKARKEVHPINDGWVELLRTNPNVLMQALLGAIAAPNPIASGGFTVEEAFNSHLASLMPSQNAHPIFFLYSVLQTFWLPSSSPCLSLIAPRITHSEHRFLYWDPLHFAGIIQCTACGSTLQNRGRICSGPVKVYDLDKPFFIIGCEYACKSVLCIASTTPEGRQFASTDASVMQGLPPRLRDEFPAQLLDADLGPNVWNWHAIGVSKTLWNMVKASLNLGQSKDNILSIINAIQSPPQMGAYYGS